MSCMRVGFLYILSFPPELPHAGLLDGKKATSNNMAFEWAKAQSDKALWVKHARWVEVALFRWDTCIQQTAKLPSHAYLEICGSFT